MRRRRSYGQMRDDFSIANRILHVASPSYSHRIFDTFGPKSLRVFEDRRTFHPEGSFRPARTFFASGSRFVGVDRVYGVRTASKVDASRSFPTLMSQTRGTIAFAAPRSTLVCVRRQQRKEVLHALDRVNRGRGGGSRSKWTELSNVRCR